MVKTGVWVGVLCFAAATMADVRAQSMQMKPSVASIKGLHGIVTGFITKAAAQVPEDKYSYQPTADVRTMGQLFGHIANASRMFCAGASGMEAPQAGDAEQLKTKAELQKALADAFAFCEKAYAAVNANPDEGVTFFNQQHTRLGVMAFNNAHNYEHYGNLVTYMRMNGMVPPSSGGGGD
jgi:uncharacterized damage-inducible protein DinB